MGKDLTRGENGNTRTTAVFIIKYLCSLGFEVNNEPFENIVGILRMLLLKQITTPPQKKLQVTTLSKPHTNMSSDNYSLVENS